MAVGKSSMARAAKTEKGVKKSTAAEKEAVKAQATEKNQSKSTAVKDTSVIAAPSDAVMGTIVYEECSQVLKRDAKPGESFGIGDSMPVYYL